MPSPFRGEPLNVGGRRRSGAARPTSVGRGGRDPVAGCRSQSSGWRARPRAVGPSRVARRRTRQRRPGRRAGVMPRRVMGGEGSPGSVDPTDEPADVAGGDPGEGIELEEARAPVGAAEELGIDRGGGRPAAHTAHRGRSSGDGRCGGTGHHGEVTCAFWCARIAVWAIAAHSWFAFGTYSEAGNDGFLDVCAPGRERGLVTRTGSSRRTDYSSTIAEKPRFVKQAIVRGGPLGSGGVLNIEVSQPKLG